MRFKLLVLVLVMVFGSATAKEINGVNWSDKEYSMFILGSKLSGINGEKAAKQISSGMLSKNGYCDSVTDIGDDYVDNGYLCVKFKCRTIHNRTQFVVINPQNGDIIYSRSSCK